MSYAQQGELALLSRTADEILAERLADLVEQFNASTDPAERADLHVEITKLRAIVAIERRR